MAEEVKECFVMERVEGDLVLHSWFPSGRKDASVHICRVEAAEPHRIFWIYSKEEYSRWKNRSLFGVGIYG